MSNQACFIAHEQGRITAIIIGARNATEPPLGDYIDYEGDIEVSLNHYISNGEPVEIPEQPSISHRFDYAAGEWTLDIEDAKTDAWTRIKGARSAAEFSTFEWNTHAFDCDEVSQRRIQGAVQLAALDDTTVMDWTLADNSVQTFNATDLQQIGQALAAHVNACHVKARGLRAQIDAATSEAELDAITW